MQETNAIRKSKEAKKEIDRIGREAKRQYDQWKKTLSVIMSGKQLSIGLLLLLLFYVFYALFNSITGENMQEEDLVNCTCSEKHRVYYQTLVITFCSIWTICFCLVTIWDLMRFYRVKPTNECFRWERIIDAFVGDKITEGQLELKLEPLEVPSSPKKQIHAALPAPTANPTAISSQPLVASSPSANPPANIGRPTVLKSATLKRLDHYENYLWLQFNRVYSVGATRGEHKEMELPHIKSVVADEQKIRRMRKASTATESDDEDEPDAGKLLEEEDLPLKSGNMACSSVVFFLYPVLLSARLAAQVTLIPLLILQVLDTHAWICVMKDMYCNNLLTEYQLGLDRTAIAFGFYCSVLISILATTMLRWFPCSKKAQKSGATSIA